MGLGKSFDLNKWAIEQTGAALTDYPIEYKPFAETQDDRNRKTIEDARREAHQAHKAAEDQRRINKISDLVKTIDALSKRTLTVDERLEMDKLLFGIAYYRTVNGIKERLDPTTITTLYAAK